MRSHEDPRGLEPLVGALEAARYLSISTRSFQRLVARGVLPKVRIGGSVRYRMSDLQQLIERGGVSRG